MYINVILVFYFYYLNIERINMGYLIKERSVPSLSGFGIVSSSHTIPLPGPARGTHLVLLDFVLAGGHSQLHPSNLSLHFTYVPLRSGLLGVLLVVAPEIVRV